jgi:hypothetical protein
MKNNQKKDPKNPDTGFIITISFIAVFVLLLVYYLLTVSTAASFSVKVTSWSLVNISPFYPIDIVSITPAFNSSTSLLYLAVTLKNGGNSTIGYTSGCISSFNGRAFPQSIANLTYIPDLAVCGVITIAPLPPNQTVTLKWPYPPQAINVTKTGNFYVDLRFPFGFYHSILLPCTRSNTSCGVNSSAFDGFTNTAFIQISLSSA